MLRQKWPQVEPKSQTSTLQAQEALPSVSLPQGWGLFEKITPALPKELPGQEEKDGQIAQKAPTNEEKEVKTARWDNI